MQIKYILVITLCLLVFVDSMADKTHKKKFNNYSVRIDLITRLDTLHGTHLNLVNSASSYGQKNTISLN